VLVDVSLLMAAGHLDLIKGQIRYGCMVDQYAADTALACRFLVHIPEVMFRQPSGAVMFY
jgi:hypothetical protein